jgi:hypothetical protein
MAESYTIDDFRRWKVDILRRFCQERGLSVGNYKRKDELVALAFAAYSQNYPIIANKEQEKLDAGQQYGELLTLDCGTVIPDPFELSSGWLSEKDGLQFWPPCMSMNICEYLVAKNERSLYTRLRNDYKEGGHETEWFAIYNTRPNA